MSVRIHSPEPLRVPQISFLQDDEYRTRRSRKTSKAGSIASSVASSTSKSGRISSPVKAWFRYMTRTGQADYMMPAIVLFALSIKAAVGLGSYSGYASPPLYGDMEAQRHWIALTYHLPARIWYWHDLLYWGPDYPPLTYYHSLITAYIFRFLGYGEALIMRSHSGPVLEEFPVKAAMRLSVLLWELLVWIPAIVIGWSRMVLSGAGGGVKRSKKTRTVAIFVLLLQPANILIDNGHFQYNSIMLALTLWSLVCFRVDRDRLGAFLFVCSLCFKQMALFYAPAIFAYLLGKCIWLGKADGLNHLSWLAVVTISSFTLMFAPFLTSTSQLFQALHRIFPFARGIFEDKVANFWCALNVVVKIRKMADMSTLARVSAVATLIAVLPGVLWIIYLSHKLAQFDKTKQTAAPTIAILPLALFNSSIAFFLFSFQVHEKNILLPLMPLTLIMSAREISTESNKDWLWAALVNNVAIFSMWPLLKKDGLALQYVCCTLLWNWSLGYSPLTLRNGAIERLSQVIYVSIASLHLAELAFAPPSSLPQLYLVLNVLLCAAVFSLSYLWSLRRLYEEGWALFGVPDDSRSETLSTRFAPLETSARLSPAPDVAPATRIRTQSLNSIMSDAESVTSAQSHSRRRRKRAIEMQ